MNVLVLGGTGAMGSPLVTKLAKKGNDVFVTTRQQRNEKKTSKGTITYLTGNAHDNTFIEKICNERHYSAVIDFMIYSTEEFKRRAEFFLNNTDQYVFTSSARVYAYSAESITENSPRLLEVIDDPSYLQTDEYALKKAREENVLLNSDNKNWTIIRPYITYNTKRLQLGTGEKEHWLWRALNRKSIVLTRNTAEALTSLTYGLDVATAMAETIGRNDCKGQIYHIVNDRENIKWRQILNIYLDVIEKVKGFRPVVEITDDWKGIATVLGNQYQMKYDRFYDRSFDSSKIRNICGNNFEFTGMKTGLSKCLEDYLALNSEQMSPVWSFEGYADKLTGDKTNVCGAKNKIKYQAWRKLPISLSAKIMHRSVVE